MNKNTVIRAAGAFFLVIGGLAISAAPAQADEVTNDSVNVASSITWQAPALDSVLDSITWQVPAPGLPVADGSITWQ